MRDDVLAALDCGTNSTRLLIVDAGGAVRRRDMRITRLGAGVDATRELSAEAVDRTLEVLRHYREAMDAEGVTAVRLVATSAVRDATNGDEFLRRAGDTVGTRAELLSGDEEGRLSFNGATSGLAPGRGDTVVVDIGGGSTELVMEAEGQVRAVSVDLGCVRLTERCLRGDPPSPAELDHAGRVIAAELDRACDAVPNLRALRADSRLIGLAGTVSTLAALDLGLVTYDRSRVHHAVLRATAVAQWCEVLAAESAGQRLRRPGMVEGRQDVIVGGALVLRDVMRRFGFTECLVSESDILDGLVDSLRQPG